MFFFILHTILLRIYTDPTSLTFWINTLQSQRDVAHQKNIAIAKVINVFYVFIFINYANISVITLPYKDLFATQIHSQMTFVGLFPAIPVNTKDSA